MPRSTATQVIKELEARLGVRLLQRTTRSVRSTLDGDAYYQRCVAILGEIEEAESAFRNAKPHGLLRVDVHGTLARHPRAAALAAELRPHFQVELDTSGAIGRRYRRQDEIGTPYGLTIDQQTLEDDTVTVRDRDSLEQVRIPIAGVRALLDERMAAASAHR